AAEHQTGHCGVDERLVRAGQTLVVARQQPAAVQEPGESPLDGPPPWQDSAEAALSSNGDVLDPDSIGHRWIGDADTPAAPGARVLHHFDAPPQVLLDPAPAAAGVPGMKMPDRRCGCMLSQRVAGCRASELS